jgi:hypothetical protein
MSNLLLTNGRPYIHVTAVCQQSFHCILLCEGKRTKAHCHIATQTILSTRINQSFSYIPALGQHKFGTAKSFSQPPQAAVFVGAEPFFPFLLLWYPDLNKQKSD